MLNALANFFTPEAGQARRQWLNEQEQRVGNALAYYLGPAADPLQSAALLAGYMTPGADMMDASNAGRELFNAETPMDAATAAATAIAAGGMMLLPGNVGALREGFDQSVNALAAYDPTIARSMMGPVTETPAQEVARMLAEGRAAEVTDDMMARVDPQEMWRLYEAGATGAEMPMDLASRMARAREMGFDTGTPLYHGTGQDFPAFDVNRAGAREASFYGEGVYSTAMPDLAAEYTTTGNAAFDIGNDPNVIPLTARRPNEYVWRSDKFATSPEQSAAITRRLKGAGYSGVRFENPDAADWLTPQEVRNFEVVTFDPRNIRSQFARFDPRLSHLANLSAGIALPVMGLNALAQQQQEQRDRQQITDWLNTL